MFPGCEMIKCRVLRRKKKANHQGIIEERTVLQQSLPAALGLSRVQGACLRSHPHPLALVCRSCGIQRRRRGMCARTCLRTLSHGRVDPLGPRRRQHARVDRGTRGLGVLVLAPPVPLCRSPAALRPRQGARAAEPAVVLRGSPRVPVPDPSKNDPGDKRADFRADSPQPAASKNLSLGLLPSLPFCLCIMPLPSLAVISDCVCSCFLAFPHIPRRHRG